MNKIYNRRYQETRYEETLDNGLKVILWHKDGYEKSLGMMVTPLSALDLKQQDSKGNMYEFPAGIAHFLEHKMFEMKNGDVMEEFSKLGANVNAFTSYSETAYYFSTSNSIKEPLNLLLDFVQELSINKKSVEKEKGIIIQELNMYQQMSDSRLLMETYSSLYKNYPLKYDIGGNSETVSNTTLSDLEECYRLNYHPSRMVLVIVTGEEPTQVIKYVKDNQNKKKFPKANQIHRIYDEEPKDVARKEYVFQMDVSIPKVSVAFKLDSIEDIKERIKTEWCLRILLDTYFSNLYPDFQKWIDQKIFNDYIGCDADLGEEYGMMLFYAETNKIQEFLSIVDETILRIKIGNIDERILEQLKKRYFGQAIRGLNSFDDVAINTARCFFERCDFFDSMNILDSISSDDIKNAVKYIEHAEKSIVKLLPEKC